MFWIFINITWPCNTLLQWCNIATTVQSVSRLLMTVWYCFCDNNVTLCLCRLGVVLLWREFDVMFRTTMTMCCVVMFPRCHYTPHGVPVASMTFAYRSWLGSVSAGSAGVRPGFVGITGWLGGRTYPTISVVCSFVSKDEKLTFVQRQTGGVLWNWILFRLASLTTMV